MRLTTSIAALTVAATASWADTHGTDVRTEMHGKMAQSAMSTEELTQNSGNLIRTRDITGGEIYTFNEADYEMWDADVVHDSVAAEWAQIGEIEDLVLTEDGKVTGIVAEVGGFLDIGDKHVVISVKDLNLVAVDDQTYAYVTRYNEEALEEMQSVDEGFWN